MSCVFGVGLTYGEVVHIGVIPYRALGFVEEHLVVGKVGGDKIHEADDRFP